MAEATKGITLWLKLKAEEFTKGMTAAQKRLVEFNDQIKTAASKWGAATAAIGAATAGLVAAFRHFIAASNEAEMAQVRLRSALRAIGDTSKTTLDRLNEQAGALQELTGVSDEAVSGAQAMLAQFKLNGAQIESLTPKILDMSMATGINLQTATFAAGQAMNGNATILRRYGIALSEAQRNAFNTADQTKRLAMLTEILGTKFAGAGAAMGATFTGRLGALQGAIGDIHETAGSLIKAVLTPMLGVLATAVGWFNRLNPLVRGSAIAISLLAVSLATAVPLVAALAVIIKSTFAAAFIAALPVILPIIGAVAAWTAAIVTASAVIYVFRDTIATVFSAVYDAVVDTLTPLYNIVKDTFLNIADVILGIFSPVVSGIKDSMMFLLRMIGGIAENLASLLPASMRQGASDIAETIKNYIGAAATNAGVRIDELKEKLRTLFSGAPPVKPGGKKETDDDESDPLGPIERGGGLVPIVTPEQREALRTQLAEVAADIGMAGEMRIALEEQINAALYANQSAAITKRLQLAQQEHQKRVQFFQMMIQAGAAAAAQRGAQEAANVHNIRQFGAAAANAMRAAGAAQVQALADYAGKQIMLWGATAAAKSLATVPFPANIAAAAGIMALATGLAAAVSVAGGVVAGRIAPPPIASDGGVAAIPAASPPLARPTPVQNVGADGLPADGGVRGGNTTIINVPETTDFDLARRIAREVGNEMALQSAS